MTPVVPALPVTEILPALLASLEERSNAVLVAPPGAGKTTTVPLALLAAQWVRHARIVMLEPRRLAARAAANRMASLIGERAGQTVGYRTRLDSAVGPGTRIEIVTEGLLVRRLQSDPGLENIAAVIFDEVHERNLDADLALAFCLDLQRELRPELRLIAMSATADGARLSALLDAPVIASAGRQYDVTIHYGKDIASVRELPDTAARAVRAALAAHDGDILVFLPGMGEIRRTQSALSGIPAMVLPLHGDLPPSEQDRALRAAETRRVVLSTSIAETSLTVPGVRVVIDGGYRRAPRLDAATGLTRLDTMRISRAAADQRAGRAGREGPGIAIRLWSAALHRGLAPFDRPEILDAELSHLALDCAAWGADPAGLPFIDPPPAGALAAGRALLSDLGAIDRSGRITDSGRRMARVGAHPRLAAMMLAAETAAEAALAADLAALLEERDPLRGASADITLRLAALQGDPGGADRGTIARIRQAALHYRARLNTRAAPGGDAAALLAAAFPDRIAQSRGEPGTFRLSSGGGARLPPTDPLARARLLVAAALEQKDSARITLAAAFDRDELPPIVMGRSTEQRESGFDTATGLVFSRRRRRYGAIILSDRMEPADPAEIAAMLARVLAERIERLPWTENARQLQARAMLLRGIDRDFPDLSDAALATEAGAWLLPHLHGMTRLSDTERLDLHAALRGCLSWQDADRLDRELPTHLALPNGRAAVDYLGPVPVAAARAQAFYGLKSTPKLAGGRIPLQVALLSPAGRPAAITADLEGFWGGAWADVRRDMRGRYPKHSWPENPASI